MRVACILNFDVGTCPAITFIVLGVVGSFIGHKIGYKTKKGFSPLPWSSLRFLQQSYTTLNKFERFNNFMVSISTLLNLSITLKSTKNKTD